ncbi:MAG: arginine deiminase-related protein [Pseudomonadota bacterium]
MAKPASKPRLLMCPPDHFTVSYQINPWMDTEAWNADPQGWHDRAMREWQALRDLYERLGAEVVTVDPVPGQPDMVFTANCASVLKGRALLARFRYAERKGEEPHFAAFFDAAKSAGHIDDVHNVADDVVFEGAGDAVWDPVRKLFWLGYSKRSSASAADALRSVFSAEVVPLEMVTERYYHLDVALAPLTGGEVIYIPEAFGAEGLAALRTRVGDDKLIAATQADADGFGVNAVNFDRHIITAFLSAKLREELEGRGYEIHVTPLDAFRQSGGGAFCLTLRLDDPAA